MDCLTYYDPFSATYKKYIFSQDGRYLLGGMMIGDVGDFTKLVAITKRKVRMSIDEERREADEACRNSLMFRRRSLFWVLRRRGTIMAMIWMTIRQSAPAM